MDVMNDLEKNRCLVLPSHYDFLSGELRNTDHSAYLGNARLAWNATAELAKAAYVHFSDFPVPKPWLSSNEATAAAAGTLFAECSEPCPEKELWMGLYRTFREEMQVCE